MSQQTVGVIHARHHLQESRVIDEATVELQPKEVTRNDSELLKEARLYCRNDRNGRKLAGQKTFHIFNLFEMLGFGVCVPWVEVVETVVCEFGIIPSRKVLSEFIKNVFGRDDDEKEDDDDADDGHDFVSEKN
ncbi:hypothetical protein RUM44_010693 [Polyplax serrata]|uniref:Uncharacterized protein n=1 Tax=Polyplax serrata TaxID=468196 RepID=A0ABR1ANM2_POLSC